MWGTQVKPTQVRDWFDHTTEPLGRSMPLSNPVLGWVSEPATGFRHLGSRQEDKCPASGCDPSRTRDGQRPGRSSGTPNGQTPGPGRRPGLQSRSHQLSHRASESQLHLPFLTSTTDGPPPPPICSIGRKSRFDRIRAGHIRPTGCRTENPGAISQSFLPSSPGLYSAALLNASRP